MNKYNKGFISLAFGKRFAEMALDMALSLREFHTEPVSIAVDRATARYLTRYKPSPFDQVVILPQRVHPFGARFLLAGASPYQHTVSVDADILFLTHSPFLEYDFTAPLAMYGAYMPPDSDFQTYYPSKQIFADFGLGRYFWGTGGIFVFKKKEVLEMFRACYEFYTKGIKKYPRYARATLSDEMVIGIMGDRYPIDSLPCPTIHPWPMARDLSTLSPDDRQWPVFHMFAPPNNAYMDYLMEKVNSRRSKAGFALVSEQIWRHKGHSVPSLSEKLKHVNRRLWRKIGIWNFGVW